LSEWSARDAVRDGLAETRLGAYQLPSVDLWAVFPAGRQPSARARAFTEYIKQLV
jgi:DNA-binding transcriptional LysR family regulator